MRRATQVLLLRNQACRLLHHSNNNNSSRSISRSRSSRSSNCALFFPSLPTTTTTHCLCFNSSRFPLDNKRIHATVPPCFIAFSTTTTTATTAIVEEIEEEEEEENPSKCESPPFRSRSKNSNNNNDLNEDRFDDEILLDHHRMPYGFWNDPGNHVRFFKWAAKQLGVTRLPDDWYNVSSSQFHTLHPGASSLLKTHYGGSHIRALMTIYPEFDWMPWRFSGGAPKGFWQDPANQRRFLEWALKQLGMRQCSTDTDTDTDTNSNSSNGNKHNDELWYNVSSEDIRRLGGAGLLDNYYQGSLYKALSTLWPDTEWLPWRFATVPSGFWKDPANHRRFFDWAARQLKLVGVGGGGGGGGDDDDSDAPAPPEAWLSSSSSSSSVSHADIARLGGASLLASYYGNSLPRALLAVYPEYAWLSAHFAKMLPKGYWSDVGNQRKLLQWAASKQLSPRGLPKGEADADADAEACCWYHVTRDQLAKLEPVQRLLRDHYGGSLLKALSAVYPDIEWLPWRFTRQLQSSPWLVEDMKEYWADIANRKRFFEWVVVVVAAQRQRGQGQGTAASAAAAAAAATGAAVEDCWYTISAEDVRSLGGAALLDTHYEGSLLKALVALYPEVQWIPWRFSTGAPRGFWKDLANHKWYFDWAAQQLGVRREVPEDWYRVTREDVYKLKAGQTLIDTYYGGSLLRALSAVYPLVEWHPWRFPNFSLPSSSLTHSSSSSSNNNNNNNCDDDDDDDESLVLLRRYIDFLARELSISSLDDWYRVSADHIRPLGGYKSILARHGGLYPVLQRLYPEHSWDEDRFHKARGKKSSQRVLKAALYSLFNNNTNNNNNNVLEIEQKQFGCSAERHHPSW